MNRKQAIQFAIHQTKRLAREFTVYQVGSIGQAIYYDVGLTCRYLHGKDWYKKHWDRQPIVCTLVL